MTWLDRRAVLSGLTAWMAGCARGRPAEPLALGQEVVLGWRLVSGAEHSWRTVIQRTVGTRISSRAEVWTYRVREQSSDGIAQLEARLTGFGAGAGFTDGELQPGSEARLVTEQSRLAPVLLRLGADGVEALSERDFARALPHRLLGLRLPRWPLHPGDEWPDPTLAQHFAGLMPPDPPPRSAASCRLLALEATPSPQARLQALGEARSPEGPAVVFTDTVTWNAERGLMETRTVTARLDTTSEMGDPGELSVSLQRMTP